MNNWTIGKIESTGLELVGREKDWCTFRGHGFEVSINLNPSPPSTGNLFNFKSDKKSFKGNFKIYLYTTEELNFIIERTNKQY